MAPTSWQVLLLGSLLGFLTASGVSGRAQQVVPDVKPMPAVPEPFTPAEPLSADEQQRRAALKWFTRGVAELRQQHYLQAMTDFEEGLTHAPDFVPLLKKIAPLAVQLRHPKAEEYATRAACLAPDDHEMQLLYALFLRAQGKLRESCQALERTCELLQAAGIADRRLLLLQEELAQMYESLSDSKALIAVLEKIVRATAADSNYKLDELTRATFASRLPGYFQLLAEMHYRLKHYEAALQVLQEGQRQLDNPRLLALPSARVYFDLKQYSEAKQQLAEHFELEARGLAESMALDLLAKVLAAMNQSERLLPELAALVERAPGNSIRCRRYGEALLAEKRWQEAIQQLNKCLELPGTYSLLAKIYFAQRQPSETLDQLLDAARAERVSELLEFTGSFERLLQEIAQDKGFVEQLLTEVRSGTRRIRSNLAPTLYFLMARLAEKAKLLEAASEMFSELVEREEVTTSAYRLWIRMWLRHQQPDKALAVLRQANRRDEINFDWISLEAECLHEMGQTAQAEALFKEYLKKAEAVEDQYEAYREYGSFLVTIGKYEAAIAAYTRSIELSEERLPQWGYTIRYYRSNAYLQAGQFEKAEEDLLTILNASEQLRNFPRLTAAANNDLGYIWADRGLNLERAEKMIAEALRYEGTNAAYLDSMGWVKFKRGDFTAAAKYLKEAIELDNSDDAVLLDHYGDALLQLGKKEEAERCWTQSLEQYKEENRADLKDRAQQLKEKLQLLREELQANTSTPSSTKLEQD